MSRRALVLFLFIAGVSCSLVACGGGSPAPPAPVNSNNGGSGSGNPAPGAEATATPSSSPCGCNTIREKTTKDELLGGIAVGSDQKIYATTATGVDIFDSNLDLLPSPSPAAQSRTRQTWTSVPKNSGPSGVLIAAGSTVTALGTTTNGTTASALEMPLAAGPVPTPSSQPLLEQYNIPTETWSLLRSGNYGDKWVSLASAGGTSVFVVGDHFTPAGWQGFLLGIGVGCVSPVFTHPLGASAVGPDGNLWVATDPSLNGSKNGTANNPSILYAVSPSTGQIVHSFALPNKSHISAIAAGSSAIWFTDDGLNSIGEVPTGGNSPSLIALPNNGNGQTPVSITPDSIGRMWFTEKDGKRVGYVTPATLQLTILRVTTRGNPLGIVGCVQGQNACPRTDVFFAENIALGAASL